MNMTLNTIEPMTQVEQLKAEKARISELCRKLARKLSTIEPFTEKHNDVYSKYTFLQDYRTDLVSQIQLAIRMERHGF